jgi:hypothetical protein
VIDSAALFYSYLAAQSALVTEITVGGKLQLYGPPGVPDTWVLSKALVYVRMGGRWSLDIPIWYGTMQVRCYGTTPAQATSVFRVAAPFLHRRGATRVTISGGQGLLQFGQIISGPDDMIEPEVNWPFVMALVEVHLGESLLP